MRSVHADIAPRGGRATLLAALDAAALAGFTLAGVANHDGGLPIGALARVGIPLLVSWFLAAALVGTYRRPGIATLLLTWELAVPVAAVVRTTIAGGPWGGEFLVFLGVAMAFTLLFLLVGRGLALTLRPRGAADEARRG